MISRVHGLLGFLLLLGSAWAVELDMVAVPGGPFVMGDEHRLRRDALPLHSITTDAFQLDRCEVTASQMAPALNWALTNRWIELEGQRLVSVSGGRKLLLDLGNQPNPLILTNGTIGIAAGQDKMPCVWVTWHGALCYCAIRTAMENEHGTKLTQCVNMADWSCDFSGTGYRLPTEAEWEKAARGGLAGQHFPWPGTSADFRDDIAPAKANYIESIETAGNQPQAVGAHQLSRVAGHPWGLCDMAGNVAEWCQDRYVPLRLGGPFKPGVLRLLKGGSWLSGPRDLRNAARQSAPPAYADGYIGFRVVRLAQP